MPRYANIDKVRDSFNGHKVQSAWDIAQNTELSIAKAHAAARRLIARGELVDFMEEPPPTDRPRRRYYMKPAHEKTI